MSNTDQHFKVLTYNIHKGFSAGNRQFVLQGIRSALREVDADILLLQEIQGEHHRHALHLLNWPDNSQFEFLADSIWPHHAYGKNAIYDMGHHGNAILSKYRFIRWDNIDVSYMKSASRSLLHGTILHPGFDIPLHVICVHLGLFEHERKQQFGKLMKRIHSHVPDNEPLIIAGDFNDWRGRAEHYLGRDLQVREVCKNCHGRHARTFPSWLPVLPMDRIYSRGLKVISCHPLTGSPWRHLSDHLPLISEFSRAL